MVGFAILRQTCTAEQLQADASRDDQSCHGEQDKTADLLSTTQDSFQEGAKWTPQQQQPEGTHYLEHDKFRMTQKYGRQEQRWPDTDDKLKHVLWSLEILLPTQSNHFEDGLQQEQHGEADLNVFGEFVSVEKRLDNGIS